MKGSIPNSGPVRLGVGVFLIACFSVMGVSPIDAAQTTTQTTSGTAPASQQNSQQNSLPAGTILPVVLRTSVSFDKCKTGEVLRGKIAQNVPLPNGSTIRRGSQVEGHVVQVTPAANGAGARMSIQFDKLYFAGQWIPVTTNLRAIAGFMTAIESGAPDEAPAEGAPYTWLPTTQIGGDSVYGMWGPVMSWDDASEVVGRSVGDGVLARPKVREGTSCRGELEGNDKPQALWVFSTDACGAYGIEHLNIVHAGRTHPVGTIVLVSETHNVKLRNGDGLLLRVDPVSAN